MIPLFNMRTLRAKLQRRAKTLLPPRGQPRPHPLNPLAPPSPTWSTESKPQRGLTEYVFPLEIAIIYLPSPMKSLPQFGDDPPQEILDWAESEIEMLAERGWGLGRWDLIEAGMAQLHGTMSPEWVYRAHAFLNEEEAEATMRTVENSNSPLSQTVIDHDTDSTWLLYVSAPESLDGLILTEEA